VARTRRAACLGLLAALASAPAGAEGDFLFSVPVRGTAASDAERVRLALHVKSPERLAQTLGAEASAINDGALVVTLPRRPTVSGAPEERHRKASLAIDWDDPAVAELHDVLAARVHGEPTLEELRAFVAKYIARKTLERPWDIASVVARTKAGDCTEHAVLLTALARSFGRPARVIEGVVLVSDDAGRLAGYGHAWSEIHADGAWQLVDATATAEQKVRYVPLFAIEQEGPSMGMAISVATQRVLVREIEVLPDAEEQKD
jgi:hypothetical protein